jgi:hypothetical protein
LFPEEGRQNVHQEEEREQRDVKSEEKRKRKKVALNSNPAFSFKFSVPSWLVCLS